MMSQLTSSGAACMRVVDVRDLMCTDLENGLTTQEAEHRLLLHGPNSFNIAIAEPLWKKYIYQFNDPLILLLLASAGISLFMHQLDDAISIALAVFFVVTVAFVQEYRSEKFIEALKKLVPPECNCYRDGTLRTFLAQDLVPGDIVQLNIGNRVPADVRLFEAVTLSIDESSFTGEMEPATKTKEPITLTQAQNLNGIKNMAFMGSLVCTGHGKGIVVGTGQDSEFGEIFKLMQAEEAPKTPLQKSMDTLGRQLSMYSFFVIGCIILVGWLQGRKILDMFIIGISLAVAAIPEGLPIVVTVTLAIGVMRMAKRNVIIKKLPVVEALGCVDVICCDKTGTLTKNEMTVTQIITSEHYRAELSGVGYFSPGEINVASCPDGICQEVCMSSFKKVIEIGCVCNNAEINDVTLLGSPTEGALLTAASKLNIQDPRTLYVRDEEWPFSSNSKTMMVKCHIDNKSKQKEETDYYMKGAIEYVLEKCNLYSKNGERTVLKSQDRELYLEEAQFLAQTGLRVLGMACGKDLNSLTYAGLVGIIDPPREGLHTAIHTLQGMKVSVKMLTGDSEDTAKAVGARIGIYAPGEMTMSGLDVEYMGLASLSRTVENVGIFYRVAPRHKLKIVKALQRAQHIVAMTGDGVNDAAALKTADVGISMGKTGTDVCKEAADMILVDDDFSTILAAIEEGKSIFFNIKNFVRFQLSTSIAALCLIAIAMFMRLPNPLNAMQILWINIIMDGPPAQSLGVEPVDHDVLKQPPRKSTDNIITRSLLSDIIFSSVIILCGTMWVFINEITEGKTTRRVTTITFTYFVFFDMFNALSCRTFSKSIFKIGFTTNTSFLLAIFGSIMGQMLVIYMPLLQRIFQTEALSLSDIGYLVSITSSVFFLSEVRKFFVRQQEQREVYRQISVGHTNLMITPDLEEQGSTSELLQNE